MNSKILVVDDVTAFLAEARGALEAADYEAVTCSDPRRAAEIVGRDTPALMITTLVMKHLGGIDVIRQVRGAGHTLPIMMITGYGSQESEREAMRLGCIDYLTKPVSREELVTRARRALSEPPALPGRPVGIEKMVTAHAAMASVIDMIARVSESRCRVLILGETGTGKQLLAKGVHAGSAFAAEPFVEVNCAAIPENLLESELFGHRKGAFTDATRDRIGRFEEAGAGTLFLDEIGEMPLGLQAKVLHVLENGQFTPVGGDKPRQSRARVVAATNRDLLRATEDGKFRSDLYYRLNVVSITVPPLRERTEDVPLLIEHFSRKFAEHAKPVTFTDEAMDLLRGYDWPGNVRELQNLIERLAVLQPGQEIGTRDLPARLTDPAASDLSDASLLKGRYAEAKHRFESAYLERAIRLSDGNLAAAARQAGLDRGQFYRLAKRYGLTEMR